MAKRTNNRLVFLLIGAIVILILFVVYQRSKRPKGEQVNIEKVIKRTIKETVAASGKVFPETEVKISSDVSGEIVELFVEEGDSVTIGQLLARIDPDAIKSQVERGEASVNNTKAQVANATAGVERNKALIAQAEAQKEQIEAQITNTRNIHERNEKLFKEGIISDADFEASLSSLNALEANLRSSIANLKSAEANLESAKQTLLANQFSVKSAEASLKEMNTSLRRTNIYAPTNGVVSRLSVEKGERVVGTLQMTGTEMMRIANLDAIEVQVDVSENDVLRVSLNDPVEIEVDAYIDRKFTGVVSEIANSANNSGASSLTTDQVTNFIVKIRIDPGSYKDLVTTGKLFPFRPGMSASVEINTHTEENTLSVPIMAVTTREEEKDEEDEGNLKAKKEEDIKEVVFLMESDTAKMVEVKTGIQDDEYIQVLSGLEEGQTVIKGPYKAISKDLEEGDKIVEKKKEKKKKKRT